MMAPNHRSSFGNSASKACSITDLRRITPTSLPSPSTTGSFLNCFLARIRGHLSDMLVGRGGNDLARGDVHHLLAGERLHLGGHGFVVEHHHRRTGAGGNRTGFIGGNRFHDIAVADEADEPAIAVHHGKAGDVEADELAHHMRDVIAVQTAVGLIVHDSADGLFLGLLEQGGGRGHVCAGVVMLGGLAFSGFGRDFGEACASEALALRAAFSLARLVTVKMQMIRATSEMAAHSR